MLNAFLQGLVEGVKLEFYGPTIEITHEPLRRPSKTQMKKELLKTWKERHTRYRGSFCIHGLEYHAMFAYVRSAVYTMVFEFSGKERTRQSGRPKLVEFYNGKPSMKELTEYTHFAVKEKKRRAERAATIIKA